MPLPLSFFRFAALWWQCTLSYGVYIYIYIYIFARLCVAAIALVADRWCIRAYASHPKAARILHILLWGEFHAGVFRPDCVHLGREIHREKERKKERKKDTNSMIMCVCALAAVTALSVHRVYRNWVNPVGLRFSDFLHITYTYIYIYIWRLLPAYLAVKALNKVKSETIKFVGTKGFFFF